MAYADLGMNKGEFEQMERQTKKTSKQLKPAIKSKRLDTSKIPDDPYNLVAKELPASKEFGGGPPPPKCAPARRRAPAGRRSRAPGQDARL